MVPFYCFLGNGLNTDGTMRWVYYRPSTTPKTGISSLKESQCGNLLHRFRSNGADNGFRYDKLCARQSGRLGKISIKRRFVFFATKFWDSLYYCQRIKTRPGLRYSKRRVDYVAIKHRAHPPIIHQR